MPQTPALSPTQLDAIRALLPVAGDPPAVQAQKQEALIKVIRDLQGGPVAGVTDARGRLDASQRGPKAAFTAAPPRAPTFPSPPAPEPEPSLWDRVSRAVDDAPARIAASVEAADARGPAPARRPAAPPLGGVAPLTPAPLAGTGYGTLRTSSVDDARRRLEAVETGPQAAFRPGLRQGGHPVGDLVDHGDEPLTMQRLPITPDTPPAEMQLLGGAATTPGSLNLSNHTNAAAAPAAPKISSPPPASSPAGASLNLGDYTRAPDAPRTPNAAFARLGGLDATAYEDEPDDAPAAAPSRASAPRGSLNFSDYLGGGSGAAPAPRAGGGGPKPPAARASVPKSFLGPDVAAQTKATFARQDPAPLGTAGSYAASALGRDVPIGALPPVAQREAILNLLAQKDVAPQVGGAPAALGEAPPPPPAAAPRAAETDEDVASMVAALLAEQRAQSPMLDSFRRSKSRPGSSYFGGK